MQLTQEQVRSINILLSAVQVAQRRGAFSLQDAHTLQEAVNLLVPPEEQERQRQEAEAAAAESGDNVDSVVSLAENSEVEVEGDEQLSASDT